MTFVVARDKGKDGCLKQSSCELGEVVVGRICCQQESEHHDRVYRRKKVVHGRRVSVSLSPFCSWCRVPAKLFTGPVRVEVAVSRTKQLAGLQDEHRGESWLGITSCFLVLHLIILFKCPASLYPSIRLFICEKTY